MDRPTTRPEAESGISLLPSRRAAIDRCRDRLGDGPILLTGDAGVGKTWLWQRLAAESSPADRWICVDLTPANDPNDLYRLVGHALGLDRPKASVETRIEIADHLADRWADGHRRSLVIDEAQNLTPAVWEEVRVMANRFGQPNGFASILIVGQTPLARRLATRSLSAIEARIAGHVHLGPIDADEALELLVRERPGRRWGRLEAEILHRDSSGNPRRLLGKVAVSRPEVMRALIEADGAEPLTGPAKPPLLVGENLIEVGWSPDEDPEPDLGEDHDFPSATTQASEEAVQDRYAALQAWGEWSKNQARLASALTDEDEPPEESADVRFDVERPFAPFGQLFSKMAQADEPADRRPGLRATETPTSDPR